MLKFKSCAKINLFLNISGVCKEKGLCLINTFSVKIPLYDFLYVERDEQVRITVTYNDELKCRIEGENILNKVINILLEKARLSSKYDERKKYGVKVHIHKNIPIGSGLGGGSGNAAKLLLLLNRLWGFHFNKDILFQMSKEIGYDVPFFLSKRKSSLCYGFGEKLRGLKIKKKIHLLIVFPNVSIRTKDVYDLLKSDTLSTSGEMYIFETDLPEISHDYKESSIKFSIIHGDNDLYKYTKGIGLPSVIDIIQMQRGCLYSRMSGSGSTCFGVFDSFYNLHLASAIIKEHHKDWYVKSFTISI